MCARRMPLLDPQRAARAALVYTAHSIPTSMAAEAPYVSQFAATAAAVTQLLGRQEPSSGVPESSDRDAPALAAA